MKKTSILSSLAAFFLIALTGCLKDKDFEDQKYGIQGVEAKAVAFTQAAKSPVVVGITGQADPLTVDGPFITIEGNGDVAANDLHINIQFDDAVVTAEGLTPLPAGTYTINSTTPTIKAGETITRELEITVTNSDALDPAISYGVGLRMTSVDQGYSIAANMSTVIIGFTIKNKYDGIYRLQGYHNRTPYTYPYDTEVHLITVGPSSVIFYWPDVKSNGHPIGVGPDNAMSWYGDAISPVIVFNTTTDLVTDVYNNSSGTVITMFTGPGSRLSKFDAATHAITVDWNYNGNPLRAFFDDLTYIGPRP